MPASDDITTLTPAPRYLAPDGSEIRPLVDGETGGLAHCRLPAGAVTAPVRHKTVEELWYVLDGCGEVWRACEDGPRIDRVRRGDSFRIPVGTAFQFRANAGDDFLVLIATIPPWPGAEEAEAASGPWDPADSA